MVVGYGGRGVDGDAFLPRAGLLFRDETGGTWWVIFQPLQDSVVQGDQAVGDILACSASYDDMVQVRVLASSVGRADAAAAFRQRAPFRYEEAVGAARAVPRRVP